MIIYNTDRGAASVETACKLTVSNKKRISRAIHSHRNSSHSRKRLASVSTSKIERLSLKNKNFLKSLGFTVISN